MDMDLHDLKSRLCRSLHGTDRGCSLAFLLRRGLRRHGFSEPLAAVRSLHFRARRDLSGVRCKIGGRQIERPVRVEPRAILFLEDALVPQQHLLVFQPSSRGEFKCGSVLDQLGAPRDLFGPGSRQRWRSSLYRRRCIGGGGARDCPHRHARARGERGGHKSFAAREGLHVGLRDAWRRQCVRMRARRGRLHRSWRRLGASCQYAAGGFGVDLWDRRLSRPKLGLGGRRRWSRRVRTRRIRRLRSAVR
mmetsp:Transcript_29388/g.73442  ORF Transcript_29388/g.73442 Transcript_29388/m.73442 type:complete len:248 (-) Transcript_29388:366-1109(-)